MTRLTRLLDRLATALLGPRCHLCRERVYPRDAATHDHINHAGEKVR